MTADNWLQALFWVFTPAYILVAGALVRKAWREGIAKGDSQFPWYWAIVALGCYFMSAGAALGRGGFWSPSSFLPVMILMTAGVWFLALHILKDWRKARRAKGTPHQ